MLDVDDDGNATSGDFASDAVMLATCTAICLVAALMPLRLRFVTDRCCTDDDDADDA